VWLHRSSVGRDETYPCLRGSKSVDVAIVGGGITGTLVAATFASAGVRVGVVEAARVGRGSTAASTALILQEPDQGLGDLVRRYGSRAGRRIWALSHHAARELVETLRRLDVECDLEERDTVYCTTGAATVEPLRSEFERRRRAGFAGEWLGPGALRRLTAIPGRAGIRTVGGAQLNPYRACLGLLNAAARAGAEIYERSAVKRILRARNRIQVVTSRGTVDAEQVIIATGYATPSFRPLHRRFKMAQTYVLATRPMTEDERKEVGLGDVMVWDTERPYHYVRWTPDRRLLIGGADRPVVSGRRRAAQCADATRELREHFERLLPALADIGFDHAWEGLFASTPDSLPYIGPHPRYPRHLFALGYGGNGMTFGSLAARILLEHWQGVRSPDHKLFSFSRDV
jgi:glycine/D-amino acid oxidase-like deaminating enzyme